MICPSSVQFELIFSYSPFHSHCISHLALLTVRGSCQRRRFCLRQFVLTAPISVTSASSNPSLASGFCLDCAFPMTGMPTTLEDDHHSHSKHSRSLFCYSVFFFNFPVTFINFQHAIYFTSLLCFVFVSHLPLNRT